MPVPAWLQKRGYVLWDTADVIVKRVGEEAYAIKTDTREVIAHGKDHAEVIQKAIDSVDGGDVVWIGSGRYTLFRGIKGRESVVLVGVRGKRNDPSFGTVFDYQGEGNEAVLDFTEKVWFGIVGIKVLGNGRALYGIRMGSTSSESRPKHLLLENIEIDMGGKGTGIDFGDPSWDGFVDDTELHNIVIKNADKGIAGAHTQVKFYHLVVASSKIGVYPKEWSQLNFYGCVFTGNEYDILYPSGKVSIGTYNFYGCWFEESTKGIVAKEDTEYTASAHINFFGCRFHTSADPATYYALDLEYIKPVVNVYGGEIYGDNKKVRVGPYTILKIAGMAAGFDLANSSISGVVIDDKGDMIDSYNRLYIYSGKQDSYGWVTLRPRGSPSGYRQILDLHYEDKLSDTPVLRLATYDNELRIMSYGFGTYTPLPLAFYYGATKVCQIDDDKVFKALTGVVTKVDVGDYGGNFANYTPSPEVEGVIIIAIDTNSTNPGKRLYVYANGAWHYVDLT